MCALCSACRVCSWCLVLTDYVAACRLGQDPCPRGCSVTLELGIFQASPPRWSSTLTLPMAPRLIALSTCKGMQLKHTTHSRTGRVTVDVCLNACWKKMQASCIRACVHAKWPYWLYSSLVTVLISISSTIWWTIIFIFCNSGKPQLNVSMTGDDENHCLSLRDVNEAHGPRTQHIGQSCICRAISSNFGADFAVSAVSSHTFDGRSPFSPNIYWKGTSWQSFADAHCRLWYMITVLEHS